MLRQHLTAALVLLAASVAEAAEPVRFPNLGTRLAGPQLQYDVGFEVMDWDADGKPDLLLPNTGMMSFVVHLNEGSKSEPRFGHAVSYPLNLTETVPQTIEHNQAMAVGDLNGDGLWDLVCFDGRLRMIFNVGSPRGPYHWDLAKLPPHYFPGTEAMIQENARYATGPESMFWNKGIFARQVLTLTIADWDGDGLNDLLICRFKDEAPGVAPTGGAEQWTPWGRLLVARPTLPPPKDAGDARGPLAKAPPRGTYFYRNLGTREKPHFDKGVEITTPDGQSLAAPNPVAADLDGDGVLDLLTCETGYSCNAFRVDWPTNPHLAWYRRPSKDNPARVEAAQPVNDAAGQAIAAGTQARLADLDGNGTLDLLVMDAGFKGTLRWYRNASAAGKPAFAPPQELRGSDFLRFDFMAQPLVVDWFAPKSRDLIVHGNTDAHCKWALRRTALYRNVATQPGQTRYEFVGHFTYRGDPAMVPPAFEERPYDVYGSSVAVFPGEARRLLMSVNGQLYLFADLAPDGLTFRDCRQIDLPHRRSRIKGTRTIAVGVPTKVKYIRIGNDRNGMGNLRDSFLHVVRLEAFDAAGMNRATLDEVVSVKDGNREPSPHYRVQRPTKMFDPANQPSDTQPNFTSFGYYIGPATITFREPFDLRAIRLQLSDREERWYHFSLPFYWQGRLYRDGTEQGEPWYQYKIEVSADGKDWTTVADTMRTEMMRTFPTLLDWDGDGRTDLVLGVLNSNGIWPADKEYRLYRNRGTEAAPEYGPIFEPLCDETGNPIVLQADWYLAAGPQCGTATPDLDGDGRPDLVVEGFRNGELQWYRNLGDPKGPPMLKKEGLLGSPNPLRYANGYRYFAIADADGDGTPDLLNSTGAVIAMFKGVPPRGPLPATDEPLPSGSRSLAAAQAVTLDAQKPADAFPKKPSVLIVRAQVPRGEKQKVALLRFTGLPDLAATDRAVLELTADPSVQEDVNMLRDMATLAVSCNAIRDDWDAEQATWTAAAAGKPWAEQELDAGGQFLSMARPQFDVRPRRIVRWDVTEAVRQARREGRSTLSLLVRVDYTGPYVAGAGYRFCGPEHAVSEHRPRLVISPAAK